MSSYNTDTISDAKDEFSEQTGNSRPQWDVANYQSVLDKYNFSNSCKNLGQFIDGRAPANNAFEQIASDGHFPRDVRKDAEEHLGTTEELAKEKDIPVKKIMTDQNVKLLCKKKVNKKDKKLILESVEFTYFKKELTKILVN